MGLKVAQVTDDQDKNPGSVLTAWQPQSDTPSFLPLLILFSLFRGLLSDIFVLPSLSYSLSTTLVPPLS